MTERADVVIDFSQYVRGTKVFLLNTREKAELAQLMRFDVSTREGDDAKIPARLADPGFLARPKPPNIRTCEFRAGFSLSEGPTPFVWTINGKRFDPDRSDANVLLGEIELWRLRNDAPLPFLGKPHNAHVHLTHFQILERNGKQPMAHERGWKDTVVLERGEEALVMLRFEQFRGRYLLHCYNLEHERRAMMSCFDIIRGVSTHYYMKA